MTKEDWNKLTEYLEQKHYKMTLGLEAAKHLDDVFDEYSKSMSEAEIIVLDELPADFNASNELHRGILAQTEEPFVGDGVVVPKWTDFGPYKPESFRESTKEFIIKPNPEFDPPIIKGLKTKLAVHKNGKYNNAYKNILRNKKARNQRKQNN